MIDIVPTSGEVKPYLDVTVPEGWFAFEHSQLDEKNWPITVVQLVAPDGFYRNVHWTRAQQNVSTRNHIASILSMAIVDALQPGLKLNDRLREARKICNV